LHNIVALATRLNVLAFAWHTHEHNSALATRALIPDTIVRVEINRPQESGELYFQNS